MPQCGSCKRQFTGNFPICNSCRCNAVPPCGKRRHGHHPKCRTHLGLCLTETCHNRISGGKIYCPACEVTGPAVSSKLSPEAQNIQRRAFVQADSLRKTKAYREHIADVLRVLIAIGETKSFNKELDDLVGWKNLKSWTRWAGRALEPSMLKKARYTAIVEVLTQAMLAAGIRRAYFAEKFLEEMILVCRAEMEKTDISFIVSQGFMVFGPLLAPLSMAAGAAAGGGIAGLATRGAISAGQQLAQMGIRAGANVAAIDPVLAPGMNQGSAAGPTGFDEWNNIPTRGRSNAVSGPPPPATPVAPVVSSPLASSAEEQYHYQVNPMQYAVCLFKYLTTLPSPAAGERLVINEFGGSVYLARLYDMVKHPPVD